MANPYLQRRDQMFPRLSPEQVQRLSALGQRKWFARGTILFEPGERARDFLVVISGSLEIVQPVDDHEEPITIHAPGEFTGETNMLSGRRSLVRGRMREGGELLVITPDALRNIVQADAELSEILRRAFILRPAGSVFARVKVPSDGSVAGFGYQVADRMGDAVAYVLTPTGRPRHSTVFLLRAGATHGQVLYSGSGDSPCAIAVGWHDRWLLFAPVGGRGLLIDTTGQSPPIDLTAVIHGLPGHARMVRWAYRLRGPGPIHAAAATA